MPKNVQTTAQMHSSHTLAHQGFPDGPEVKMSASKAGDLGSIPGSGRPPEKGQGYLPTPAFLPGESHGQRSLVGYSPPGLKELDMTEQLHSLTC